MVNVNGNVSVVDQDGVGVRNAQVTVSWFLADGSNYSETANSNRKGVAKFSTSGERGTYTLTVTNIARSGYTFDVANSVLSDSITR